MAAVDKAVAMMESLQNKVLADGEAETASYNKFACFCKDSQREKEKSIREGKDEKGSLISSLQKLQSTRKAEDKEMHEQIRGLEDVIKKINKDLEKEAKKNAKEVNTYEESAADLSGAIEGITNAMKSLKASKP